MLYLYPTINYYLFSSFTIYSIEEIKTKKKNHKKKAKSGINLRKNLCETL